VVATNKDKRENCRTIEEKEQSKIEEFEKQNLKIGNYKGRRKLINLRQKGSSMRKLEYEVEK